ncbi:MAG: glycosyltransferase family 2 protein [Gammaproteobacteria bacterium]
MATTDAHTPFVSVVLCTYNRIELLKGAVGTLLCQSQSVCRHELLIVDNNSSDGTREYAMGCSEQFDNVRYIYEKQQGLSYARNRGLKEAYGEYVAYIDDDCEVPKDYIARLVEVLSVVKPTVLGGPAYAFYRTPKPAWYKDEYAQYELADHARRLEEKEYAYGFNMIYRRTCLESVGGFDPALGMIGDNIGYGEDVMPQILIREKIPDSVFYYDPSVCVFHLVRPEKMTLRWNMRTKYQHGVACNKMHGGIYHDKTSRLKLWGKSVICILGLVKDAVSGLLTRDKSIYPYYQNYLYEHTFQYLYILGRLHYMNSAR